MYYRKKVNINGSSNITIDFEEKLEKQILQSLPQEALNNIVLSLREQILLFIQKILNFH